MNSMRAEVVRVLFCRCHWQIDNDTFAGFNILMTVPLQSIKRASQTVTKELQQLRRQLGNEEDTGNPDDLDDEVARRNGSDDDCDRDDPTVGLRTHRV